MIVPSCSLAVLVTAPLLGMGSGYNEFMKYDPTKALVFVDVETTGMDYIHGQIIEIAAIRYENGQITQTLHSLLRPARSVHPNITMITGITNDMVTDAPVFADIACELHDLCNGAYFVAHNVQFDFGFMKQEFLRVEQRFNPELLCTVRLSRALYPRHSGHSLEKLIARHNLSVQSRHRAYDDAKALVQFWEKIHKELDQDLIASQLQKQLSSKHVPAYMSRLEIESLPDTPGVYIFYDEHNYPLYIGKSNHIRTRVNQHFQRGTVHYKEFRLSQSVKRISCYETNEELHALLLESKLVKELSPIHNMRLQQKSHLFGICSGKNDNGYTTLGVTQIEHNELLLHDNVLSIHYRKGAAQSKLETIVKYSELCPKLCGLDASYSRCFARQIDKCRGACEGIESADSYNKRVESAFAAPAIKPWLWGEPMVFAHKNSSGSSQTGYVVDNWIVQRIITYSPNIGMNEQDYMSEFDLDAYTLLYSHMSRAKSAFVIVAYSQYLQQISE